MTHLQLLKKEMAAANAAALALAEARAKAEAELEEGRALLKEAEALESALKEVDSSPALRYNRSVGEAAEKARRRLREIRKSAAYQVAWAEAHPAEALEADLARREAARKAKRAKAKALASRWEKSQELYSWAHRKVKGLGPKAVAVAWGPEVVSLADLRAAFHTLGVKLPRVLKRTQATRIRLARAAAVLIEAAGRIWLVRARGEAQAWAEAGVCRSWEARWEALPRPLRRACAKKGWVEAPAPAPKAEPGAKPKPKPGIMAQAFAQAKARKDKGGKTPKSK